jgi:hypothetical protein
VTKTALGQLQDQIEAIRDEAYAAGYAAAMQAVRDFSARPTSGAVATSTRSQPPPKAAPAKPSGRPDRSPARTNPAVQVRHRPQRGTNARLIIEVLKASGSDFVRPAAIRTTLQNTNGAVLPFTSIRHALSQLQSQGLAEPSGDGKSWRYMGS